MPVTRYVYAGPNHLVGEDRNGTESLYRHDAMGSTTQLVNASGAITDTFSFDFYGNSLGRTGSTATPMQWRAMAGTYSPQGGATYDLILPRSLPWSGILKPLPYDPIPGIPIVGPPPGWFPIVPPFLGPWHPHVVVRGGGSNGGSDGELGGGGGPSFGGGPTPPSMPPNPGSVFQQPRQGGPRTPSTGWAYLTPNPPWHDQPPQPIWIESGFSYGQYCGSSRVENPALHILPQDCADECCLKHDRCLEGHYALGFSPTCAHRCCDTDLSNCEDVVLLSRCCERSPDPFQCRLAAQMIHDEMRLQGIAYSVAAYEAGCPDCLPYAWQYAPFYDDWLKAPCSPKHPRPLPPGTPGDPGVYTQPLAPSSYV